MCAKRVTKQKAEPPTTGHEWDGIREFDNPMPRWWVWVFYLTILWGIWYSIAYPAWPLIEGATRGYLGQNTRADVEVEIATFETANGPIQAKLVAADLDAIEGDPALSEYARSAGAAVFKTNCATCHGAGAAGVQKLGYPSLVDNDWLWGGTMEDIHLTIAHGIRNTTDDDARYSEMPKFGADELLEKEQIGQVVEYVLSLTNLEHDAAKAAEGMTVYMDNCASCHMEDGTGDRAQGAPNLADFVWLYGDSREAVTESVFYARFGVMPDWNERLREDQIRAVAFYVHGLGGGE